MAIIKIKVTAYKCDKCGHVWQQKSKKVKVRQCPKCKTVKWNDGNPKKEDK